MHALQRDGHAVAVLDDLSSGSQRRLSSDTPLFLGSVLDTAFVIETLRRHRAEGVHLAARRLLKNPSIDLWLSRERHRMAGPNSCPNK
jgi:UDP-glucose 4-epimerase